MTTFWNPNLVPDTGHVCNSLSPHSTDNLVPNHTRHDCTSFCAAGTLNCSLLNCSLLKNVAQRTYYTLRIFYNSFSCLTTCILAYLHTCILAYTCITCIYEQLAYLHTIIHAYMCILAYVHMCILAYVHTYILAYFHILAYLFNCLYLTQFLTDFSQILDSKSYDQA